MSPTDDGGPAARFRLGRAPATPAGPEEWGHPADAAWRAWERLRAWDQRFAIVVDTVIAVGLFVFCSGWYVHSLGRHPDLGFVAGLTLPLILRRRAPMGVFLVLAVVAAVQWGVTVPLLADAALLVALYTVAADSDWIQVAVASIILEIGVILATVRWAPVGNYFKSVIFLTGMAFAALMAGVVVRALRSQLGWLAERARSLELERDQQASLAAAAERARIAREMHDMVSHNIQVMVTLADAAAIAERSDPQRAVEAMGEVSSTGRQALGDMRRLLGLLRDGGPDTRAGSMGTDRTPAALAPPPGLGELEALVERVCSTGLAVTVAQAGEPFALSEAAGLTVYRIVQEALTNALKHAASADAVEVALSFHDPDLTVRVTDNGRAAAGALAAPVAGRNGHRNGTGTGYSSGSGQSGGGQSGGGHGMAGMAERASAFGGTLSAGPGTEGGWSVTTTLRSCKAPVRP
ncbi:MAG TPA: histidine kinase [Acidimicrobiales bacterium]|jgi:signal transduction histidine kinase|nr:histidine kinase [Acidimicrobiales bacterium]